MAQQIETKSLHEYLLDGVEFVGIISKHGRLVDHISRKDLSMTKQQREMFFMSVSLHGAMQHDYDESFGIVKSTIMERENFMILSAPIHEDTLIVVMNKNGNFSTSLKTILESINLQKKS